MMTRMIGLEGGGRLCLAMVMAGTLAQISFAAAYSYDDPAASERTLYVELDSGTEYFVADWITPAGATVTNLVKRGDGLLYVTNDFSALVFDTRVEDGILRFSHKNALGSSTAGVVTVCDGATLRSDGGPSRSLGSKKIVRFEGRGHDGMGALYKTNYDWGSPFGYMTLTGDAFVHMVSAEDHPSDMNLNGHVLEIETGSAGFVSNASLTNFGTMVWSSSGANGRVTFDEWLKAYATPSSKLAFSNITMRVTDWHPINGNVPFTFNLEFREGARMNISKGTVRSTYNQWLGPTAILRDVLPVTVDADKGVLGFGMNGAVSGGGFNLTGRDTTTLDFHLKSAGNTFTNGISGAYASLHLGANGSLPGTGGPLVLTTSTCELEDIAQAYSLPDAVFDGDCAVTGGWGRWRSLAKTGNGTLAYESMADSDTLDISGGVVDLSAITNRAAYAGLVEGRKTNVVDYSRYTYQNDANYILWVHINNKGYLLTNTVTRGTRLMYDGTKNLDTGWTTNCIFTYSGYIWNNSPTNEVWAFASAVHCYWRIDIDNQFAMGYYD